MGNSLLQSLDTADVIAIIYISLQLLITLCVSIAGVFYVRKEFTIKKQKIKKNAQIEMQIEMQIKTNQMKSVQDDEKGNVMTEDFEEEEKTESVEDELSTQNTKNKISKMHFFKLWAKIVWKMRSVYTGFGVHVFDVLTDILVITNWYNLEQKHGDIQHIDARIMAYCGIFVLLFHRFVSMIAFWIKEKNYMRCILQLIDLLIFKEIYLNHQRVVSQFRNQLRSKKEEKKKDGVDTTNSFKFIRNLEAIFESLPQSILQMVFILRTSSLQQYNSITLLIISIVSIIQSMISMTNAILKNDNIYMVLPKFDKHKKRFPPTIPFLKHALCRISEIFSRIALLSLFWTVCGGLAFGIFAAIEAFIILSMIIREAQEKDSNFSVSDIFLRIHLLILLPSELVYAEDATGGDVTNCLNRKWNNRKKEIVDRNYVVQVPVACGCTLCCCYWPAALISTCCTFTNKKHYFHPNIRLGLSLFEWMILILWPILFNETRYKYLFSTDHGLYIFIFGVISYIVYFQYLMLFPNFVLPHNVNVRSRFGYALNGEIEELKRINLESDDLWDKDVKGEDNEYRTVAMFALCFNYQDIVDWLETEKKAVKHQIATQRVMIGLETRDVIAIARDYIDPNYEYFSRPLFSDKKLDEFEISDNGIIQIEKVDIGYKITGRNGHQSLRIKFNKVPDKYYYEAHLHSLGDVRIGFADDRFAADPETDIICGNDEYSWSYHAFGQCKWNNSKKEDYGHNYFCRPTDIIGCFVDIKERIIKFSANGDDLGIAFNILPCSENKTYPSCTLETGESITIVFDEDKMIFKPHNEGCKTLHGTSFVQKDDEKESVQPIGPIKRFEYESDFDSNGIIYYVGTNGGTAEFKNPAENGVIEAISPHGPITPICGRQLVESRAFRWWMLDFCDNKVKLEAYTLKLFSYGSRPRSWRLEGKNRNGKWKIISNHENDEELNGRWEVIDEEEDEKKDEENDEEDDEEKVEVATKTWEVESNEFYSQFFVIMTKPDTGGNWDLNCSGVEFYGILNGEFLTDQNSD